MAEDLSMDLVMVAPQAQPPVCRIVDFGKFKYEQKKMAKESKAKRKVQEVKGIKFQPGTAIGDLQIQLKKARAFLGEGHKVRFVVRHRARELSHPEIGRGKLQWFVDQLGTLAMIEKPTSLEGNQMTMVLSPGKKPAGTTDGKVENKQDGGEAVQDHGDRQDHAPEVL
jgi:translation initiation factor IF-3